MNGNPEETPITPVPIPIPIVNKPVNRERVRKVPADGSEGSIVSQGNKPAGWWSVSLEGSLEGVTGAIEKEAAIPDHWKTAIKSDIAMRCGSEFNFVSLDAHFHVEKGNAVLHYHAVPSQKTL